MSHLRKFSVAALYITWLLLTNLLANPCNGQDPVYWQLTDEDGLPSMTIYELTQDDKGYIWIGTSNGLARFDGKEFKHFQHHKQKDNEIVTVQKDNYGRIWYSDLSNQLFFIQKDSVFIFGDDKLSAEFNLSSYLLFRDHLVVKSISPLKYSDSTLVKIIPLWNDLARIQADSMTSSYLPGILSTCVDRNGAKYLYTYSNDFKFQNGLYSENKRMVPSPFDPMIRELKKSFYMPYNSSAGSILEYDQNLIAKFNNSFCITSKESDGIKTFSLPHAINQQFIIGHELWLLTKNGLRIFDLKKSKELKDVLFSEFNLTNLLIDKEGNHWFGTDKNGILIVPSFRVKKLQKETNSKTVHYISSDPLSKTLNIGLEDGLFKQIDLSSAPPVEKTIQLPERLGKVNKYLKHEQHYFATDIGLINKKTLDEKGPGQIMAAASVKNFIFDQKGNLWLADSYSVFKIAISAFLDNSDFKILPSHRVLHQRTYGLLEAFDGTIWMGSIGGLYSWKEDTLTPFLQEEDHITYSITDIIQTPDSTIWVATNSEGLLAIKNDKIVKRYSISNGLPTNKCNKLFSDDANNIWVATSAGLVSITPGKASVKTFNIYDGLPSNDVLCMTVLDSTIWAGTTKGLVSFPVNLKNQNQVPPPIYLTRFSIHEKDTLISDFYTLKHYQNSLQIDFRGLNYRSRGKISYQYQMIGIDSIWRTTNVRFVRFPALSPGNYTFNVLAINEDGIKSSSPVSIKITISPAWWNTWWFRIAAFFAATGVIWFIFNQRLKNVKKEERLKREFQEKVNELSMRALQTQMNPHFIFNSLNAIQHFLTINDQENAMIYLSKFARLIRMVFDQSSKTMISLEEEIAFLKLYLKIEDLRFNHEVAVSWDIDQEIMDKMDEYQVPPLIIQPILENAFKHGLFHKEGEKKLNIVFKKHSRFLKCIVTDNGVGIEKAKSHNEWRSQNHNSAGIKTIRERLTIHHDNHPTIINKGTFFDITELFEAGKSSGTQVTVII